MIPLLKTAVAMLLIGFAGPARAEGWPRTIAHAGGELVLAAAPERIVSTSPSLTGTLLAIEAPLIATAAALVGPLTDDKGFFRQWAPIADARNVQVMYPQLGFDLESVLVQDPDLVVVSATGGDSVLPHVAALREQGFPVIIVDYSATSWEDQAALLGRATGREDAAAAIARDFAAQAAEVGKTLEIPPGPVNIVSYNFAGTYAVSQPTSPQARVLAALGFTVSGLPGGLSGQVRRSTDFDFVSHENLPLAISGDSLFLLNGTPDSVAQVLADPVLANVPAVQAGRVYPLGPTSFRVDYYSGLAIIETVTPLFRK